MEQLITKTSEQGASAVVERIVTLLQKKPNALLCLAAGHSSLPVFQLLLAAQRAGRADFSAAYFVGLDDWLGVAPTCTGACCNFLRRHLFTPLGVREEQLRLFDPLCADAEAECASVERFVAERGGIDFMLLGIGMNGHLALNEPGESFTTGAHAVPLSETTRAVAPKYFPAGTPMPERGITLGLGSITAAKALCLTIFGEHKRAVAKRLLEGPVEEAFPASVLKNCPGAFLVLDEAAAGEISVL